ncbi:hypothetical protein DPMN_192764 [Dreissena polymorpha]|uniref:Uncharacterized protein n=1 Tax=Dreissena polymorpha TaxID=45954 RepID=A0A9D4BDP4_DREPO|nr:hypothetical protein DPMN_192764 [Dreissena polymorpha]
MRAENIVGNSTWTDYITISTLAEIEQKGSVSKAVGGTVGGLSVICIIVAVIIVWRRRKTEKQSAQTNRERKSTLLLNFR